MWRHPFGSFGPALICSLVVVLAASGSSQVRSDEVAPASRDGLYRTASVVHTPRDPAFAVYWSDVADAIAWNLVGSRPPVVHTGIFKTAVGRALVVTTIDSADLCGIAGCPVRIQAVQGSKLARLTACDLTEDHHFSSDGQTFIACDERFSIPQSVQGGALWAEVAPEPQQKSDLYKETRSVTSASDPDVSAYWSDLAKDINWKAPPPAYHTVTVGRFTDAANRRLVATTIYDPAECGIKYCPLRVFTEQGDILLDSIACNDNEFHRISSDRRHVIACGQAFQIPEAGPRRADVSASKPPGAQPKAERIVYDDGIELANPGTLQDYWSDRARLINWKAPVAARGRVYNMPLPSADGRSLVLTTLQSSAGGSCNPLCPVRIVTANHKRIVDVLACSDRTQHSISADHRSFIACGVSFAVPQVDERTATMENAPTDSDPEAWLEVVRRRRMKSLNAPQPFRVYSAIHNRSDVLLSEWKDGSVEITYDHPRSGLPVAQGTLLFRGVKDGDRYSGIAYTFKKGCPPAAYTVSGAQDRQKEMIVLTGAAPRRDSNSCDFVAASAQSGHATLVFDTKTYGDE